MAKYFSKTTGGFYDDAVYRLANDESTGDSAKPAMPVDAVEVTDANYKDLFEAQASGQVIQADSNGNPAAVIPTLTPQQAAAALQISAKDALDKSDTVIVRCYSASPIVPVPSAWTTYRSALRAIANGSDTTSASLPSVPAYPEGT